jgi:hypothetical protein
MVIAHPSSTTAPLTRGLKPTVDVSRLHLRYHPMASSQVKWLPLWPLTFLPCMSFNLPCPCLVPSSTTSTPVLTLGPFPYSCVTVSQSSSLLINFMKQGLHRYPKQTHNRRLLAHVIQTMFIKQEII